MSIYSRSMMDMVDCLEIASKSWPRVSVDAFAFPGFPQDNSIITIEFFS